MKEPLASPVASCPECGKLWAALNEALGQLDEARKQICRFTSRYPRTPPNSTATPRTPPRPLRSIHRGLPNRSSRPPPAVSRADNRGILEHPSPPLAERVTVRAVCARGLRRMPELPCPRKPDPGRPEPTWHQVAEIPPVGGHRHRAPRTRTHLPVLWPAQSGRDPAGGPAHVIGPRLAAVMSYFSGRHHLSRRGVEEIVETVFEVPTSLGTGDRAGSRDDRSPSAGLIKRFRQEVRQAAGEEHRRDRLEGEAGQKRWLWAAATATAAFS